MLKNIKNKRQEKKEKIKLNLIYIIFFNYIILNVIFLSHFTKCYNSKIKLAYSYINLKVIGKGDINIYNDYVASRDNVLL